MALNTKKYNRVVLRHEQRIGETKKFEEEVFPGQILEPSDSSTDVLRTHSTEGGDVNIVQVAEINYLLGKEIDEAYSEGERGPVLTLRTGDKFVCRLADGTNYSDGDILMSAGNGDLKQYTAQTSFEDSSNAPMYPNRQVARLLEDADLSGGSSADASQWAKCEVL